MERIRVAGSARLAGEVAVTGAKNSVLKLMAAALLAPGRTTISSVPGILDVDFMSELLRRLGCAVDSTPGQLVIDVPDQIRHEADYDLVRRLRASIAVLGPLLVRCGEARVALPGGDNIGSRGLDLHVAGLQKLGAELDSEHGFLIARAPHGLVGTTVWLDFPERRRYRKLDDGGGAGPRYDGHRQRGPRARDRRPRTHVAGHGRQGRRRRQFDD